MKRSLFCKSVLAYFLIVVFLTTLILTLSFQAIKKHYLQTLTMQLENLATTLLENVTPLIANKSFEELDEVIKRLGKNINTRITIIDPEGIVLADSERDPRSMENHRMRPEILQVLEGEVGTSLRYSSTIDEEMLYVALPIKQQEKLIGVVRVSLFVKDINHLLNRLGKTIATIAIFITLLSLLGALLFSRSLTKPIQELIGAARQVASGNFNTRVFLKRTDEFKELADSFNDMTEHIRTLFSQLSSQTEQLKNIISSIQEGLLIFDPQGKIILTNESFKKITHQSEIEGKYYWEVIREHQFDELIKKVKSEQKGFTGEVTLNGKTFLCSTTFLLPREEVVLILHDITEMKNLEKIKKDFVVNVSHELRTPLTAIKGFVETLEEEIDEQHRHYINIIKRHTDRLINIVEDLLLLSSLEEKGSTLECEEVNLGEMAENILKIFEPRAKEKNLTLTLTGDKTALLIKADPFKLEQVFINLIDNAIKYTERGTISLILGRTKDTSTITIKDTGIGIAEEHLPRIFERFYVVDKSRSKRLGGTGLGLSIVKHIILLHQGAIEVSSNPGEGTTFLISLPLSLS